MLGIYKETAGLRHTHNPVHSIYPSWEYSALAPGARASFSRVGGGKNKLSFSVCKPKMQDSKGTPQSEQNVMGLRQGTGDLVGDLKEVTFYGGLENR